MNDDLHPAEQWELTKKYFNALSEILTDFASRYNLLIDKYYHDSPSWTFRFKHFHGGVGSIQVSHWADDDKVNISTIWYYDDFGTGIRYSKSAPPSEFQLKEIDLLRVLEDMLKEIINWKPGEWNHQTEKGRIKSSVNISREQHEYQMEFYSLPRVPGAWFRDRSFAYRLMSKQGGLKMGFNTRALLFIQKFLVKLAGHQSMAVIDKGNAQKDQVASSNPVNSGYRWECASKILPFFNRTYHTATTFMGKIWVIGGIGGEKPYFDIWSSSNGSDWNQETRKADFGFRGFHSVVAHEGKMFLVGGMGNESRCQNDVWSTNDGIHWDLVIAQAGFAKRTGHTCVQFKNQIWLCGGGLDTMDAMLNAKPGVPFQPSDMFRPTNDVWRSKDGNDWECVVSEAPFSKRNFSNFVAFKNKLWVIGGETKWNGGFINDIWCSEDGIQWTQVTACAEFNPRRSNACVVYDDKLWIFGGMTQSDDWMARDVWCSEDGMKWVKMPDIPSGSRCGMAAVVFGEKLYSIAGLAMDTRVNDCWVMSKI